MKQLEVEGFYNVIKFEMKQLKGYFQNEFSIIRYQFKINIDAELHLIAKMVIFGNFPKQYPDSNISKKLGD